MIIKTVIKININIIIIIIIIIHVNDKLNGYFVKGGGVDFCGGVDVVVKDDDNGFT